MKKLLILLIIIFLPVYLSADENIKKSEENISPYEQCEIHPWLQGCFFAGAAPVIGFQGNDIAVGIGTSGGMFIVDRLSLSMNVGWVHYPDTEQYAAGPSIDYFIGPLNAYYLTIGYRINKIWQTGVNSGEGYLQGPTFSILNQVTNHLLMGIGLYYNLIEFGGTSTQKFDWSFTASWIF